MPTRENGPDAGSVEHQLLAALRGRAQDGDTPGQAYRLQDLAEFLRRARGARRWAARLGKNPTRPKNRIKNTGEDVYLLLHYVRTYLRTLWMGPQVQALRQIFLQNLWIDERARVRWRVLRRALTSRGCRDGRCSVGIFAGRRLLMVVILPR
ncbi:hypothetical protein OG426_54125 [Streptomyces canus]|uniref:hypothetical protein n=1 Tax=Streptomyces canus TaxID=58343 RepID=UPI00224FEDEA|nr:hypothetical protein [Streptomyces canus]MCX4853825.1 hypothetical protein [Streptomyces canus]WSW40703.1 hypothetical protein OG426_54125 [Streptomyces canus]